jgi:predicted nucleotidyltransferase
MSESLRVHLLREAKRFVRSASQISGVTRIAVLGSLLTGKESPKDADLLVTIGEGVDTHALAAAGRRLKGRAQNRNAGADIFLCSVAGEYLGRTCSYKDCRPRMACRGRCCGFGSRICDDLDDLRLDRRLVLEPPLEVWPEVVERAWIPPDVRSILLE